jgi:hypothetical protein
VAVDASRVVGAGAGGGVVAVDDAAGRPLVHAAKFKDSTAAPSAIVRCRAGRGKDAMVGEGRSGTRVAVSRAV